MISAGHGSTDKKRLRRCKPSEPFSLATIFLSEDGFLGDDGFLSEDDRGGVAEALSDVNKGTYEKRRNHFWIRRTKYALGTRPGAIFLLKIGIYFEKRRPEKQGAKKKEQRRRSREEGAGLRSLRKTWECSERAPRGCSTEVCR